LTPLIKNQNLWAIVLVSFSIQYSSVYEVFIFYGHCLGSRVAQQSKALHLSARLVTTVPGSNPGCITSGRDWESYRVDTIGAGWSGSGHHCKKEFVLNRTSLFFIFFYYCSLSRVSIILDSPVCTRTQQRITSVCTHQRLTHIFTHTPEYTHTDL
jgi:hypothetical protein